MGKHKKFIIEVLVNFKLDSIDREDERGVEDEDLKSVWVNTKKDMLALESQMTSTLIHVIHTRDTTELINDVIKSCG